MNKDKFLELLEKAKVDENGNLYVENMDVKGRLLNSGKDDEYDHMKWYFSLSNTVCSDLVDEFCSKNGEGFELYDRHFIDDDTLQIKIVRDSSSTKL